MQTVIDEEKPKTEPKAAVDELVAFTEFMIDTWNHQAWERIQARNQGGSDVR